MRTPGTGTAILVRAGVATVTGVALAWSLLAAPTVGRQVTDPIPADKQAILDRYANLSAQGATHAAQIGAVQPLDAVAQAAPMAPLPGAVSGVGRLNSDADTLGPPGIPGHFTNSWYVIGPPITAIVWAGATADDPSQGVVVASFWNDPQATSLRSIQILKAPRRGGALHLESANGYVLNLRAADGSKVAFDVTTSGFGR